MPKPKVFINNINKSLKNNIDSYHFRGEEIKEENVNVNDVLRSISKLFSNETFVYKINALITLKNNQVLNKEIISLQNGYLISLDGDKISLSDIKKIKKAN